MATGDIHGEKEDDKVGTGTTAAIQDLTKHREIPTMFVLLTSGPMLRLMPLRHANDSYPAHKSPFGRPTSLNYNRQASVAHAAEYSVAKLEC